MSDFVSSDDGEDGEDDDDEETEQGQPSEDDKPGWVMGTISKIVPQRMERVRQKQTKFDELTQPGWEVTADYLRGGFKKYGTRKLRILAVVKPQKDNDIAAPAPTLFGEHMDSLDIVPWISLMPHGTSRPGSTHISLCSGKLQSNMSIPGLAPAVEPDPSLIQNTKPVDLVSIYPAYSLPSYSPYKYRIRTKTW